MTRRKWAVIVILIVASTFILSFTYQVPTQGSSAPVAAGLAVVPTQTLPPTTSPTWTMWPSATPTTLIRPTVATSPSARPTLAATATLSVTDALTVTLPTPGASISATQPITSAAISVTWPFDTHPDLPRYIYIDQGTQYLYIFQNGQLLRDIPASSGLPYSNTYTPAWEGVVGEYWGTFFAFDVFADEAWYLYKSDGSILIHSLPYTITQENGPKEYQDREMLGVRPSSHGCIRLSPEDAAWLTAWNPEGVPITVSDPYRDKWQ